jgi:hypothetical protein
LRDLTNTKTGLACTETYLKLYHEGVENEKSKKASEEAKRGAALEQKERARGYVAARLLLVQFVRDGRDINSKTMEVIKPAYQGFGGGKLTKKAEIVAFLQEKIAVVISSGQNVNQDELVRQLVVQGDAVAPPVVVPNAAAADVDAVAGADVDADSDADADADVDVDADADAGAGIDWNEEHHV